MGYFGEKFRRKGQAPAGERIPHRGLEINRLFGNWRRASLRFSAGNTLHTTAHEQSTHRGRETHGSIEKAVPQIHENLSPAVPVEVSEYRRPVTHEWGRLLRLTHSEMDKSGEDVPTDEVIKSVWKAVEALDDETLEDLRFHGIGLIMCGVAISLHDPDTRSKVIRSSAGLIAQGWGDSSGSNSSDGLLLSDVNTFLMNMPYQKLAEQSAESLPRGTVLLADTLNFVSFNRSIKKTEPKTKVKREPDDYELSRLKKGDRTHKLVANVATDAATGVIRLILNERYLQSPVIILDPHEAVDARKSKNPSVAEALAGSDISDLNSTGVAMRAAASMRQDEFLLNLEEFVEITADGKARFLRDRVVRSRDLPPPPIIKRRTGDIAVLHQARLKCPAVFVDGFIPMMVDIVNETITEGQRQVDERLQRKRNSRFGLY
jgi:hypothetical protein